MANEPPILNKGRTWEAAAKREAFWREVVQRWKGSGLAQRPFCEQEDLSSSALSWWIRELRRRDEGRPRSPRIRSAPASAVSPTFVPVRVRISSSSSTEPLEIVVGRYVIRVRPGFDREALRSLLAMLEERPC